MREEWIKTNV